MKPITLKELKKLVEQGWQVTYISSFIDYVNLTLQKEDSFFEMKVKVDKKEFFRFINFSLSNTKVETVNYEREIRLEIRRC
ncbi:MAG: hypothetical protein GXO22_06695 [Aquificae bacterium]|nr:hypothetical protein [Aquificota bacterium]